MTKKHTTTIITPIIITITTNIAIATRIISITATEIPHPALPGMPFALHEAGFGFGILLVVTVAYVTDLSLVLLISASSAVGSTTYQVTVTVTYVTDLSLVLLISASRGVGATT